MRTRWVVVTFLLAVLWVMLAGEPAHAERKHAVKKLGPGKGEITAISKTARLKKATYGADGGSLTLGTKTVTYTLGKTPAIGGVACKSLEDCVTRLLDASADLEGQELRDVLAVLGDTDLPAQHQKSIRWVLERWAQRADERKRAKSDPPPRAPHDPKKTGGK